MLSFTPATTGPPGSHSRTDVRSPERETLASDVSPGLRRLDSTTQPHIPKLGYGSVKVKTSGLGSGSVNAFRWKSKMAGRSGLALICQTLTSARPETRSSTDIVTGNAVGPTSASRSASTLDALPTRSGERAASQGAVQGVVLQL